MQRAPGLGARDAGLLLALLAGGLALGALGAVLWAAGTSLGLAGLRDVGQNVCNGAVGSATGTVTLSCLLNPGIGGVGSGVGGAAGGYGDPDYDPRWPVPPGATGSGRPAPDPDRPYGPTPGAPVRDDHPDPQAALNDPAFADAQQRFQQEHPNYSDDPNPSGLPSSGDVVMGVIRGMRGF
ncbi:MAG TPA: hypothetical protein VFC04_04460 [Actinomycetota bacterium]|nr:hypothetical protein [Actinomycetota bacterium]